MKLSICLEAFLKQQMEYSYYHTDFVWKHLKGFLNNNNQILHKYLTPAEVQGIGQVFIISSAQEIWALGLHAVWECNISHFAQQTISYNQWGT